MKTVVEPLEGNKVKLSVEIDEQEFEKALDAAFRKLAREVRIPGFRPGKAPRRLLEARLGSEVAREQALQDALPEYYVDAVNEHDVDVIAAPEIQITAGQDDVDRQVDALRERFADLADSDFPLVDDAYATIDIAGTIDGEAVEGLTASD